MSDDPVRLGMIAPVHSHANAYASALSGIDGAELVGVAGDDRERATAFAERTDVPRREVDELLASVDGAIVCAANVDHVDWIERIAEAGVDVLCEKPLATTTADAERAVAACNAADVSLGVAMPVRFSEPARRARAAVESGDLGELQAVVGTNLLRWVTGGWIADPERAGGGAIMDHSVHVIDLVRWITGQEVAEVYAETGTLFADIDVEDVDVLSMALEDGTPFTHDGSWRQPANWETWGDVTLRLIGTDAVIEVDCFDQTLDLTRVDDEPGRRAVYWGEDANRGLLADFVESIREERPPEITGEEAVREVAVVEAAYESVEATAPVPVSAPDRFE